ncbi:MAG: LamG domain-containing protein [Flavobacteriaceae bacterium]|nr:LamG domain-containing protein [Flavobacteriaceae bacterium]
MIRTTFQATITVAFALFLYSCHSQSTSELKNALTFYVSFDEGTTADFALGDPHIYTAQGSYVDMKRKLENMEMGMHKPGHGIAEGKGVLGNAFEFGKERNNQVIFYKSKDNIAHDPSQWSGSISFWLSVDPVTDLNGYTDPIQITDVNFNDASIWVDFTDDNPPNFRLGVIGDKSAWTQDTLSAPSKVVFEKRIVTVEKPSFSRTQWTHVLITYHDLGTSGSSAILYLNGDKKGEVKGLDDPFTWELEASNIFLGLGFTGVMDELAIFNKPLSQKEVKTLYQLKGGIKSIL